MFEKLNRELVKLARISKGRKPLASGAVADSQSIKTTERGALEGSMAARKLREERDIYWLTVKD